MSCRVVTWNVLWRDRFSHLKTLLQFLSAADPDILMLQETNQEHAHAIADALGLTLCAIPDDSDEAIVPALLTRLPHHDAHVLELPRGTDASRHYASIATIEADGLHILTSTTHLRYTTRAGAMALDESYASATATTDGAASLTDPELRTSVATRLAQLGALATHLANATGPQVLGGDFNFLPAGPEHRFLTNRGWTDAWRAGPRLGSGATILDRNPLLAEGRAAYADQARALLPGSTTHLDYTLDFQFARGPFTPVRAWTLGEPAAPDACWPSDHLGLAIDYDADPHS